MEAKGPTNGQIVRYALSHLLANLGPDDIENMMEVPDLQYDSRAEAMVDDVQGRVRGWLESGGDSSADCWPAAPQLLEALRKMRKRFDPIDLGVDDEEACDLADAAIRAAEGGGV